VMTESQRLRYNTLRCGPEPAQKYQETPMSRSSMNRRDFLATTSAAALAASSAVVAPASGAVQGQPTKPIGQAKGIHPGRVVWVHDPDVLDWKGPEDGRWYEGGRLKQDRVNTMMSRAVCALTGAAAPKDAWDRLFRHHNAARGKGEAGYKAGQKVLVKPNWVGLIHVEPNVDHEKCTLIRRENYMNTAPQMLIALLGQLVEAGVKPSDITVSDTLACLVNEYYTPLSKAFPQVRYENHSDLPGRVTAKNSDVPLYWSCRPEGKDKDVVPTSFAEADYLVNFANLKAHRGAGVTLCAKNHYGSLVRTPPQKGFYDMHPACFAKKTGIYRPLVDLLGHEHLGGKTVLNLIDGIFSGLHPSDLAPKRMKTFGDNWPSSLLASQDPLAIDSVGLDFLQAEWTDFPHQVGVDDYLREAALASDPPSGTFYDPNHDKPTQRLASLGVHEHWNNPQEKKYSRNLGAGNGIELVAVK